MYLEKINSPADLRKLTLDQLPALCDELRKDIVDELAVNPGHLASSLGALELTVAIHYVFNTPDDRLVWDVGHQAYGHKILTGRREAFCTNRKLHGIRPFPSPAESEYDTFTCGHASNSISAALGMAVAAKLTNSSILTSPRGGENLNASAENSKGQDISKNSSPRGGREGALRTSSRHIVAVIGDGAMSGGLAFEGLNNVSSSPNDLLIVLNDNNMSIDRSVGGMKQYLLGLNTNETYNSMRYHMAQWMGSKGILSDSGKKRIIRLSNAVKSAISSQQNIFEGMNIRYFGPVNGNDVREVVRVLRQLKDMTGPKLLHLHTIKGHGYKPAEQMPTVWHAPGKFNPKTGERLIPQSPQSPQSPLPTSPRGGEDLNSLAAEKGKVHNISKNSLPLGGDGGGLDGREEAAPPKFQTVFGETLLELAKKNPRIVGVTPAMPTGCSMNIMMKALPNRTFDVGIAEGHAVTFSGGMAKDGLQPFCNIYSAFAQRAYDNIIHDVAIQNLPVVLCFDRAGLVGEDGPTHHGAFDMAALRPVPNLIICSPMDEHELRHLMYTAQLPGKGTWVIRYPRGCGSCADWRCEMKEIPVGKGRTSPIPSQGGETLNRLAGRKKVAVLTIGPIGVDAGQVVNEINEAALSTIGESEGTLVAVHYDMRFLKPIDEEILREAATFDRIITIEDGSRIGGLGSAVCEWLQDNHFSTPVTRLGLPDNFVEHGTVAELRQIVGLDKESIRNAVLGVG